MAGAPGWSRLSRRHRRALLLGAAPADPRATRGAHHRAHDRVVPQELAPAQAGGERVAVHLRGAGRGRHTTIAEHMPSSHRRYAEWTLERIRIDAAAIGPSTAKLTELILESRPHPEQGYRACIGILRLGRQYGAARLEAACDRGRHRRPVLRIDPVDPQAWARQAAGPTCPAERAVARPPQHPRLPLLPLRRLDRADPSDH